MEKRLIISVFLVFIFSLNAQAKKGTFSIAGIKIGSPAQNEIVLEEESYLIDENDLFRCVYKMHNKGEKGNVNFSLNVTTENQEQGVNYCETLIPEDFAIFVDGTNSDFSYKNEDAVLNSQDIFKIGVYEHGTTGDIIFSLEMKPNELKTIEIDYSINPQGSYWVNFAQDIKYGRDYKRKVAISNADETFFIDKVMTWDKNPYDRKFFLDLQHNYFNCPDIEFERSDDEIVLNFVNFELTNICVRLSLFMISPFSAYDIYPSSVVFQEDEYIFYKETEIPKLNLFFLNKKQLWLLRNAFYACHGYKFENQTLTNFFLENCYKYFNLMEQGFDENSFNEIERKNIELIREMENMTKPLILSDYLK